MNKIRDGTAGGMIEWLEWAAESGEMNAGTARSYRSAVRSVLEARYDDSFDHVPVRDLDVKALTSTFEAQNPRRLAAATLSIYVVSFERVVEMYVSYLDGDDWRRGMRRRTTKRAKTAPLNPNSGYENGDVRRKPTINPAPPTHDIEEYRFMLRPDFRIRLELPRDLSIEDAERLANFVRSLAFAPTVTTHG